MQNLKKRCGLIPSSCKSNLCQTKYPSRNRIDFPRRGRSRTPNVLHCILCTYRLSTAVESKGSGSCKGIDPAFNKHNVKPCTCRLSTSWAWKAGDLQGHRPRYDKHNVEPCTCRLSTSWAWKAGDLQGNRPRYDKHNVEPCTCRLSTSWERRAWELQAHRLL